MTPAPATSQTTPQPDNHLRPGHPQTGPGPDDARGFPALTGMVGLDAVVAAISDRFSGPVAEGNAQAARAAFDLVATNGRRSPMLKQIGVCPDNAIIKLADGQYAADYEYCTGCGLCAAECPCGAIDMEPEQT